MAVVVVAVDRTLVVVESRFHHCQKIKKGKLHSSSIHDNRQLVKSFFSSPRE